MFSRDKCVPFGLTLKSVFNGDGDNDVCLRRSAVQICQLHLHYYSPVPKDAESINKQVSFNASKCGDHNGTVMSARREKVLRI